MRGLFFSSQYTTLHRDLSKPDSFALVGCTISPGFHFDDFEMDEREKLIVLFPKNKDIINRFTR